VNATEMAARVERSRRRRPVAVVTAIIAVLAALGTLFAHHRSIGALSMKNQAILTQARASDTYNAYEAKQIRYNIYQALLASDLIAKGDTRSRLVSLAENERISSAAVLEKARSLERQSAHDDERSEAILRSYEILQYATSAFEVSIILISISALAGTRILLPFACGLSGVGLVLFVAGLFQGR
jgi:hypothetical protein